MEREEEGASWEVPSSIGQFEHVGLGSKSKLGAGLTEEIPEEPQINQQSESKVLFSGGSLREAEQHLVCEQKDFTQYFIIMSQS